jgi:ectoine hydroxylase-related dioxygenase (phytanoyl-CoA dioxygenase family)
MTENRISFAAGVDVDAATAQAKSILENSGVVVLDDLVDRALVSRCREEIEEAYPDMARVDPARNFGPYVGRHTMPIVIERTLADPAILLPQPVRRIAAALLGRTYKVDSVGLLVSVPGAPDQKRHPDATLFPKTSIDRIVPTFAIAFALPLVRMDEVTGRTAFWRGSHRGPKTADEHEFAPIVEPGSAILWDYRIHHCGLANRSERPRPVLFTALSREWWIEIQPVEAFLYEKLLIARSVHGALDPRWQHRFNRAKIVDDSAARHPLEAIGLAGNDATN